MERSLVTRKRLTTGRLAGWQNRVHGAENSFVKTLLLQFTTIGSQDRQQSCETFELILKTLHQAMQQNPVPSAIALELGTVGGEVVQAIRTTDSHIARMLKFRLRNDFEGIELTNRPSSVFVPPGATELRSAAIVLENDFYPIKRWRELLTEVDPLTGILASAATNRHSKFSVHFSLSLTPVGAKKLRRHRKCFERLQSPFFQKHSWLARWYEKGSRRRSWFTCILDLFISHWKVDSPSLSLASSRHHERETDLQSASNKLGSSCFYTRLKISIYGKDDQPEITTSLLRQIYAPLAQFNAPRLGQFRLALGQRRSSFLLDCSEVASMYHPPVHRTETQARHRLHQLEPPMGLPLAKDHDDLLILGKTAYHGREEPFGLFDQDASLHGFVVGSSGSGKTTLLKTAISSLIRRGVGFSVIDYHGDFAREVSALIPKKLRNRVVHLDATSAHPTSFNPLACPEKHRWPVIADSVLSAMIQQFGDSWGPRLQQILSNALSACIAAGDTSFMDVRRMLENEPLRVKILSRVDDPLVREFWLVTFQGWSKPYRQEAIQSVINKLDALLTPKLRAMLCQTGKSFDFREAFDQGKFVIVNLARGEVGPTAASILGSLVLSSIQNAALSRSSGDQTSRKLHYVFLDEVQLYSNPQALTSLLSEARKYRVAVWSATQSLSSVSKEVLPIIIGNAANFICFRVGYQDAAELQMILNNKIDPDSLISLPRFKGYAHIQITGEVSEIFSFQTSISRPERN